MGAAKLHGQELIPGATRLPSAHTRALYFVLLLQSA